MSVLRLQLVSAKRTFTDRNNANNANNAINDHEQESESENTCVCIIGAFGKTSSQLGFSLKPYLDTINITRGGGR